MTMFYGLLLILCLTTAFAAPPEISLTIHRVVDEDQGLNETLNEASDVLDHNITAFNTTEITDDAEEGDQGSARLARETNITKDEEGNLIVQLPKADEKTTNVKVGTGTHIVNQVSGELAVESKGGWDVRLQTAVVTLQEQRHRSTDHITRILFYDKQSSTIPSIS